MIKRNLNLRIKCSKKTSFYRKSKKVLKEKGIKYLVKLLIRNILNVFYFNYLYYKLFCANKTFLFQGQDYKYFYHIYNYTWENERSLEIPIMLKVLKENKDKKILEVGNVLSHYFPVQHDVVDKYEKAKGVINEDIVKFNPKTKYDLIISISTIEHVGWDEKPKEPQKVLKAIENLKKCLSSQGKIIITFPLGYNHFLDGLLQEKKIFFSKEIFLKKVSKDSWIEKNINQIKNVSYGFPYLGANGIIIGIIKK